MTLKFFSNTNGYNDNKYTDYIPDSARKDCRAALKFADELGCSLNFHIEVEIPSYVTDAGQPAFQRMVANKLRVHADDNGFDAYQLMHRSCDLGPDANPRIDILYHVPDSKVANFTKVVAKWPFVKAVTAVTHEETVLADGTVQSVFNELFAVTSPKFAADHPTVPYKPSGPVLGDRTFYSRSLWGKHRFRFWKAEGTK